MSKAILFISLRAHLTNDIPRSFLVSMLLMAVVLPMWAADKAKDEETLQNAANVLQEMLNDKNIAPDVVAKADCIIVLPSVKKFGFGIGGSGGRGPMACRTGNAFKGPWSAPAMYTVGGVSAGLQVGGSSSDFVVLLMNEKVVNSVLNGKTTMGKDATATAGPTGATAASSSISDILTYGRAKGLFAGVSLGGASLEPDNDANRRLYGKTITPTEILRGSGVQPPTGGDTLVSLLNSKAAKQ